MSKNFEFSNQQAEQELLGAIIIDNNEVQKVSEFLKSDHFSFPDHQTLYTKITEIIKESRVADILTICHEMKNHGNIGEYEVRSYLQEICRKAIAGVPVKSRAQLILDLYLKKSIFGLSNAIQDGINGERKNEDLCQELENKIFSIRQSSFGISRSPKLISGFLGSVIHSAKMAKNGMAVAGHQTGFHLLDDVISGLNPSDLLILAARPSMGKTAFAVNVAYNIACQAQLKNRAGESVGKKTGGVAFFTLEMSSEQIAMRILSMVSGVSSNVIRTGKYSNFDADNQDQIGQMMSEDDFQKLTDVSGELSDLPFFIDDTPSISTSQLRAKARLLKQQHDIDAIFIDYLQLMRGSESAGSNNRVLEISEISQTLKAIAKELDIPVIALSQLSRQVEARDDKRPQLADLRESGSIEQDADIVMFLYREEYYLEKSKPKPPSDPSDLKSKETTEYNNWIDKMFGKPVKGQDGSFLVDDMTGEIKLRGGAKNIAEIIVSKHRNGPTGNARLFFSKKNTAFFDLVE